MSKSIHSLHLAWIFARAIFNCEKHFRPLTLKNNDYTCLLLNRVKLLRLTRSSSTKISTCDFDLWPITIKTNGRKFLVIREYQNLYRDEPHKIDGTSDGQIDWQTDRQPDRQRGRMCRTGSKNDGLSRIFVLNSANVTVVCVNR